MKIVFIDSGFNPQDVNTKMFSGKTIQKKGEMFEISDGAIDNLDHGTQVVNVFNNYYSGAQVYMLKIIINLEEDVDVSSLIFALEYAHKEIRPDIINVSVGVEFCENYDLLHDRCKKLSNDGIIIVSAYSNTGAMSFPAGFDCVIGVDWSLECVKISDIIICFDNSNGKIDVYCSSSLGKSDIRGNSFISPYVASLIATIMGKNAEETKSNLMKFAKKIIKTESKNALLKVPKEIKKAIVFPYNKEIKSLLLNSKLLVCDVSGIYDTKYSRNIGTKVVVNDIDLTIENFKCINWDYDFDSLVLGHVDQIESATKFSFKDYFVKKCAEHKKFLYSFENLPEDNPYFQILNSRKSFYLPSVNSDTYNSARHGKLYRIPVPVVAVFGTGPRQGKFTLQQVLRHTLSNQGYSVGYLSTEPSGFLLGADAVFPNGYNSTIKLSPVAQISCINELLFDISKKSYDLIITGGQSQVVCNTFGNIRAYPLDQYNFLIATEPDLVVLCVNFHDEIDLIKRTITFVESAGDTLVIALVLFHKDNQLAVFYSSESKDYDKAELCTRRSLIEHETSKKVYTSNDNQLLSELAISIVGELS